MNRGPLKRSRVARRQQHILAPLRSLLAASLATRDERDLRPLCEKRAPQAERLKGERLTLSAPNRAPRTRGTILIVALVLVFAIASMVVVLGRSMRVEAMAAANDVATIQASEIERGAERYVMALTETEKDGVFQLEESNFAGVPVGNDGFFWIVRPDFGNDLPLFGVTDESSKIDINQASAEQMYYLGMTLDQAGAIVDWRDTNSDVTDNGAEDESYMNYVPRNSPFESLEELMQVRGFNNLSLYGDGSQPPLGIRVSSSTGGSLSDQQLLQSRGLADYLTIYNVRPNTLSDGTSLRININASSTPRSRGRPSELAGEYSRLRTQIQTIFADDTSKRDAVTRAIPSARFTNILQFYVELRKKYDSLEEADWDQIADLLTTVSGKDPVRGSINLNTVSREVLLALSGLSEADVDALLNARGTPDSHDPGSITWVVDAIDASKLASLSSRVAGRATNYSADIVAVNKNGRGFKRIKLTFDVSSGTPVVLYRRDLSGWGWPLDQALRDQIRAGNFVSQNSQSSTSLFASGEGQAR